MYTEYMCIYIYIYAMISLGRHDNEKNITIILSQGIPMKSTYEIQFFLPGWCGTGHADWAKVVSYWVEPSCVWVHGGFKLLFWSIFDSPAGLNPH